ncbi:hypothetical protein DY000_02049480 [Brassica cretica]|uniref:AMP-dependent synthetase/ligase domain-containing protein n=1 Tax=Brassica cretica TaxID=69181 RepID=A0ABQ7F7Q7_BRACR|nr:hypothetical protein DY000_02049480 [Brassica cretica]
MANSSFLLADFEATFQICLLRFWKAMNEKRDGERMGVDMLLLDSKYVMCFVTILCYAYIQMSPRLNFCSPKDMILMSDVLTLAHDPYLYHSEIDGDFTTTCLIDGVTEHIFTYPNVQITLRMIAAGIHRLGIRHGDTVMLLLPNSPEFAPSFLTVAHPGAISTTVNPFYTDVLIVCVDEDVPFADGCVSFTELTQADETDLPKPEISPEDTVSIPYSSGSTGFPKDVIIHDENDLKIGVLRRSRQLLPAFAEIAYLPRLHQDHKRERESFFSQCYPDLVDDDVELQDDSMTEVIV